MLRKLRIDSLKADLATVNALLHNRSEEDDPIGWYQLSNRKADLQQQIAEAQTTLETNASVGLFFGGRPVYGSKGILADFAGKAIEKYQDLIAIRFASKTAGPLGAAGRVPLREQSQLMITDVARGSFGFILEEVSDNPSLIDSPLRIISEEIAELIYRISLSEDDFFDSVAETLDGRLLSSLQSFFKMLDDCGATLRIVEGEKEYQLDRDDVQRARSRTETMEIKEDTKTAIGRLFLMPNARKFELHLLESREVIRGAIDREYSDAISERGPDFLLNLLGQICSTKLGVKEVCERNRTRNTYTLLEADRTQ